jgi:hypothetical protein
MEHKQKWDISCIENMRPGVIKRTDEVEGDAEMAGRSRDYWVLLYR